MYAALSAAIGALTSVMILMNGVLAQHVGNYAASAFVHLTGLAAVSLALLVSRSGPSVTRFKLAMLSGGALGFSTVVLANTGFATLGVSLTLGLGLLGQTVASIGVDHFGILGAPRVPLTWRRVGAVMLIVAGIAFMACW